MPSIDADPQPERPASRRRDVPVAEIQAEHVGVRRAMDRGGIVRWLAAPLADVAFEVLPHVSFPPVAHGGVRNAGRARHLAIGHPRRQQPRNLSTFMGWPHARRLPRRADA